MLSIKAPLNTDGEGSYWGAINGGGGLCKEREKYTDDFHFLIGILPGKLYKDPKYVLL